MRHIVFARLPDADRTARALQRLREAAPADTEVLVHRDAVDPVKFEEQIQHSGNLGESDLRHALVLGALLGSSLGAIWGMLLALIGLFPGSVGWGAAYGALMGLLVGMLMMSIVGTGLIDRRLRRLARGLGAGEVLLTVDAPNREVADMVIHLLERDGAHVAEKGIA